MNSLGVPMTQGALACRVSLIVPICRDIKSISELFESLQELRMDLDSFECLVVAQNNLDGTKEWWKGLSPVDKDWFRLVSLQDGANRDLAAFHGIQNSRYEILVVSQTILSNPRKQITELISPLYQNRSDFVMGSFQEQNIEKERLGLYERFHRALAALLARPFVRARDPMPRFFAFRRIDLERTVDFKPHGQNVALELIVKSKIKRVSEVFIFDLHETVQERKFGIKKQLEHLRHLRHLANYKYGNLSFFLQFGLVGLSGTFVNLISLTLLMMLGVSLHWAVGLAIWVSMTTNFALNRFITFNYATEAKLWRQYLGFAAASSVGALVNYFVTIQLTQHFALMKTIPQLAAVCGILAGMFINFLSNRYLVFPASSCKSS